MAKSPMKDDKGSVVEIRIEIARTKPDGTWTSETYVIDGAGKLSVYSSKEVKKCPQ